MDTKEIKQRYRELYDYMAASNKPENMHLFGSVMTEMFDWFAANRPDNAEDWLWKLEAIQWNNYLTPKEADNIVADMEPKGPWSREAWKDEMETQGLELEEVPCYNRCALYVTMNMIYSDSIDSLSKYINEDDIFTAIYDLAIDKLKDKDKRFNVRSYFSV